MKMKTSFAGRALSLLFLRLPFRYAILRKVVTLEGGDITSVTLRRILERHFKVSVGAFSYGSLLWPGACDGPAIIGPYVSIGPNVRRFGASHPLDRLTLHPIAYNPRLGFADESDDVSRSSIEIGPDVWIGANVTILPGVRRIGAGAVIGAGSVVTKNVNDFEVAVGNPARVVKTRLSPEIREVLILDQPWERTPEEYLSYIDNLNTHD